MQQIIRHRIKTRRIAHCTEEQIQRHLARGKVPPAVVRLRLRPLEWRSWAARIRNATRP
jgi:hypothetical protein